MAFKNRAVRAARRVVTGTTTAAAPTAAKPVTQAASEAAADFTAPLEVELPTVTLKDFNGVAIIKTSAAPGTFYLGFLVGNYMGFWPVATVLHEGQFRVRVAGSETKFFLLPVKREAAGATLELVTVVDDENDPRYANIPLY